MIIKILINRYICFLNITTKYLLNFNFFKLNISKDQINENFASRIIEILILYEINVFEILVFDKKNVYNFANFNKRIIFNLNIVITF